MNRTNKFLLNTTSTAFLQIITFLSGFIVPKIMLTFYGSEINGLVTSITQFISYFNLVEAGLSGAAIFNLYKPLSENNHQKISGIVNAAQKYYIQAGSLFLLLTILLSIIYPFYITIDNMSYLEIAILVLLIGLNGALDFFTLARYRVLLTADQRTYVISFASSIAKLIDIAIIFFLAVNRNSIIIVKGLALTNILIRSLILFCYVKKHYNYLDKTVTPNKEGLNQKWSVLYLQILGTLQSSLPVISLTLFTKDLLLISVYTIYNMILGGINSLLSIFINGLNASFGEIIAKNDQDKLKDIYNEFEFAYYILITVAYSLCLVVILPFIKIYTANIKDTNYILPFLSILFVLNGFFYNLKTPQGMLVGSAGLFRNTRFQTSLQAMILLIGCVVLTPFYNIYGIMIASIISNVYRCIDLLFYIPKNVTKLSYKVTLTKWIKSFVSILICIIASYFISFKINSYSSWFIFSIAYGLIFFVITIGIYSVGDIDTLKKIIDRLNKILSK